MGARGVTLKTIKDKNMINCQDPAKNSLAAHLG